jgi:hypothetical protein
MTPGGGGNRDEVQGQVRGLLIIFADQLPSRTVGIIDELIDHDESGVALEVMSEALATSGITVSGETLGLFSEAVARLQLDPVNVTRLNRRVPEPHDAEE